jgi:PAS domain S-box-containing protein
MVESVTDCGIAQLDAKGRVLSWNAGAQIIDGYSAQEIVGQHFSRFYSSEEVEHGVPQRDLDSAAASGRCETRRWRARDDGSTYCAKMVLQSFHDADGTLRGFARLTRDIKELTRDSSEPPQRSQPPPVEAAPRPALRKPKPALRRSRVLFVQDHPASLGIVEQLVARRTDILLLCAANVDLAIEMAQAERPEVILLDLDLPGIDAIQFMNVLRANPATENTPILALSRDAEPAAMAKGLQAGFFHYLIKPMQPAPFLEALDDALEFAALERAEEDDHAFASTRAHH